MSHQRQLLVVTGAFILASIAIPSVMADTVSEVRDLVESNAAYTKENLRDPEGGIHSAGGVSFYSSGGLIQRIPADVEPATYQSYSLTPKHIEVISLVEDEAAVAMYYAEGGYVDAEGGSVPHYMTRITEVFVKEDGEWRVRASHYSPIAAGSGTEDTSVD